MLIVSELISDRRHEGPVGRFWHRQRSQLLPGTSTDALHPGHGFWGLGALRLQRGASCRGPNADKSPDGRYTLFYTDYPHRIKHYRIISSIHQNIASTCNTKTKRAQGRRTG